MRFIADLHIHSHYSLATSKQLNPEYLDYWARLKGIGLVATGDFTHPGWIKELKEKLEPAETGLFKLRPELRIKLPFVNQEIENHEVRFVLSSEISSIYKKNGKVRKVHNLLYAPGFDVVEKMQAQLSKIGNITSDGRPIIGFDSRNLLELALNCSPDIFFVPAHIWTPWFSVLGEKGGFNSIEECFDDLTPHIYALETGLSTNPALNWMCSFLDNYTLLSNSDAHSPERLGRNANILNCEFSYQNIFEAIKKADGESFTGTIDMFPQEGKYHYDGHRKCNVCWNPVETLRHKAICPECGKRVVIGVASRIAQLSDRTDITLRPNRRDFSSIIPLPEILAEITGSGESSKKVKQLYFNLLEKCGSEFDILLNQNTETIYKNCGPLLAEAIRRMRNGEIIIQEGFDGEYGIIKVFQPGESKQFDSGETFYIGSTENQQRKEPRLLNFDFAEYRRLVEEHYTLEGLEEPGEEYTTDWLSSFNAEQKQAVQHTQGPAMVIAGPGTGKTRVLTSRIAFLVTRQNIDPQSILAVTFTNKAAGEIKERLSTTLPPDISKKINIETFHSLGLKIISENLSLTGRTEGFMLAGDSEKTQLLKILFDKKEREIQELSEKITHAKQNLLTETEIDDPGFKAVFAKYQEGLLTSNAFDLDDLNYLPCQLLKQHTLLAGQYQERFGWIMVDEYQDINFSQYHLTKLLVNKNSPNFFIIGDPNQSIYGFRGSDISFINRFTGDFSNAKVFQLKKSYRCTDRILKASSQVLKIVDEDETLKGTSRGLKLRIDTHASDRAEAEFIARSIDELMGGMQFHTMDRGLQTSDDEELSGLSDFAILCRTRRQMDIIKTVLTEKNIPYQVIGRKAFYQEGPCKTIIDILGYIRNPDNTLLQQTITAQKFDLHELEKFKNINISVNQLIAEIKLLFTPQFSDESRNEELKEFIAMAEAYGLDLTGFLHACKLGTGIDTWEQNAGRVSLMTIHASKGLEFLCVFIPGCENGLIPYTMCREDTDIEEEKRLLYVGMTRASKYLYLSHARHRNLNNRELHLDRSIFLNNIEETLFEISVGEKKKEKLTDAQLKLF